LTIRFNTVPPGIVHHAVNPTEAADTQFHDVLGGRPIGYRAADRHRGTAGGGEFVGHRGRRGGIEVVHYDARPVGAGVDRVRTAEPSARTSYNDSFSGQRGRLL
jgi:hypothetical protein